MGVWGGPVGEVLGNSAYDPGLRRRQDSARHLYAHHESVAALLLRVDAHPLEPLDLARHLAHRREILRVRIDYRLADLERVPLQLYLLYLVEGLTLSEKPHEERNLL